MTADDVVHALGIPDVALVRKPVSKEAIGAHLEPDARRALTRQMSSLQWVAALKPQTIGIPVYVDEAREYAEVVVLLAVLRVNGSPDRVASLIHRAVSYPAVVVLVEPAHASVPERVAVSFAHARRHERKADAVVTDGHVRFVPLQEGATDQEFLSSLNIARSSAAHLFALYAGWIERAEALTMSRVSGTLLPVTGPEATQARRERFQTVQALDAEITGIARRAAKERSLASRVDTNNLLTKLRERRAALLEMLT